MNTHEEPAYKDNIFSTKRSSNCWFFTYYHEVKMSLILYMEQGTDKLNRVLYLPNNIAEVIHSDGITFNEALDDMHLDHPFEKYLPVNYDLYTTVEHLKHIYDIALILQNGYSKDICI